MKTIHATLELGKDGYGVSFDEIDNVFGFGETVEEAEQDAKEALQVYVDYLKEKRKPVPDMLKGAYTIEFIFDTAALLQHINGLVTQTALAKASGINVAQISHYATGHKKPRPIQRAKIVEGLHRIGKELLSVS
jgi:predicted RNase H-like HicB family nuclease